MKAKNKKINNPTKSASSDKLTPQERKKIYMRTYMRAYKKAHFKPKPMMICDFCGKVNYKKPYKVRNYEEIKKNLA